MNTPLDRWLSTNVRDEIEQRFYAKISEQANFNHLARDPQFMAAPAQHVGLFADHGIVHARDVANQILTVLENSHGVLIPQRNSQRFAMMQGYGVLLAYFHDIGMIDFSSFGRTMHPEYAAQAVFDPALNSLIDMIWRENSGGLAWRLRTLADEGLLVQEQHIVLREMLSLAVCHSKSKIPVALLNDPYRLRSKMLEIITTDLQSLYAKQRLYHIQPPVEETAEQASMMRPNPNMGDYARLLPDKAFSWLIDDRPVLQAFVEDITDTLRTLRAADALRQRGTVLVTSADYQIFVDKGNGSAVYALRLGEDQLYLLEMPQPISAGEANLASSELGTSGDLRLSFHHGSFSNLGATEHAARSAAIVVNDIQNDVIRSFIRSDIYPDLKPASEMPILLEETDDNPSFTKLIQRELIKINHEVAKRIYLTPSLKFVNPRERDRYLANEPLNWSMQTRRDLLLQLGRSGHPVERIDIEQAFNDVHLTQLEAGEVLVEAGSPSSFVYLALGPGLEIIPSGGYRSYSAQPWMLLGIASAVRDAERSATIVAERRVQVLIIPKTIYLTQWHQTLSLEEFQMAIADAVADNSQLPGSLTNLEKSILLQAVPLFRTLNQQALMELASCVSEVSIAAGEILFAKGSIGRSLFVVVKGSLRVHDGSRTLAKLESGLAFGEMAAVTPEPRTATVTALEDSILLRLDQRELNTLLDNNASVARGIIEVMANYVRKQNAAKTE